MNRPLLWIRSSMAASVMAALVAAVPAPAPAKAAPPAFTEEVVDANLVGAAFSVVADVDGDGRLDPVVSSFGNLAGAAPAGGVPPLGTVAWYAEGVSGWQRHVVAAGIAFPNEPAVVDLDADGDRDVVVPGGFFLCALYATNCGSLSWFEQTATGWVRHSVVADGAPAFYHRAVPVDWDGDGRLDLVTVAETLVSAHAQVFRGLVDGGFSSRPVELGLFGGSLPVVDDVDGDGDLDLASAQYFLKPASFAWLERVRTPLGETYVSHTISATEGGSIQLARVPGVGWVGTNHTNTTSVPVDPPEGVYLLTPGADPRLPWTARRISDGIRSRPHERGIQGAPGVFGHGDLDGDGDTDLGVSGDGDSRVFWMENRGAAGWATHTVATGTGQSGGGHIADLDGDGTAELLFSSYDARKVSLFRLAR